MKLKSQSGSILLSTLSFIILLALAAGSILELTMNSYKLTMRNEMRAQARAVAESELEYVYFQWVTQIMGAIPAADTPVVINGLGIADIGDLPIPNHMYAPFLRVHQTQGWQVQRSISYNAAYDYFDGIMPDTNKQGKVTYVTVRIVVLPNTSSYFRNELAVKVGRRFSTTNTSIFQYGVFYQGDLEMAPGNDITIDGDVAANGSIYMASSAGFTLTLNKTVKYLTGDYFNEDSNGNTVLRKPNTLPGGSLVPPVFGTSQATQVSPLPEPENLVGGLDVQEVMSRRPDLFVTDNDVYRAAILPPPAQDPDDYPSYDSVQGDDPVINVTRMYTRAGLLFTVTGNNVVITTPDGTDVTALYSSAVTNVPNTNMYDQREGKNVGITTVDMGALIAAINTNYPTGANDFNGAIYFNLVSSNPTTPRGVKITNAQNVYGRKGLGTTITTNGGLYVQGDFNTTSPHLPDNSTNPAMLMADQITALSSGWNDGDAAANIDATHRVASGDMYIDAGILTGSTAATTTTASGGAQNLVRYLEDWNGKNVTVFGSLGRLFESKTFESVYQQPGNVYHKPANRNFTFDSSLVMHPPAGSPTTTDFKRGSFGVW